MDKGHFADSSSTPEDLDSDVEITENLTFDKQGVDKSKGRSIDRLSELSLGPDSSPERTGEEPSII